MDANANANANGKSSTTGEISMTENKKTSPALAGGGEVVVVISGEPTKASNSVSSSAPMSSCPSPETSRFSPSHTSPKIPTNETLTRRKSHASFHYSEDSFEASPGGVRGEDEDEQIYKKVSKQRKLKYKRVKMKVLIEWVVFFCIMGSFVASLTVQKLERHMLCGLEAWKWCLLVLEERVVLCSWFEEECSGLYLVEFGSSYLGFVVQPWGGVIAQDHEDFGMCYVEYCFAADWVLVDVISSSGLSTLSTDVDENFYDGDEQVDKEITNEMEAIAAAYHIFKNVAHTDYRFMIKEEVDLVFPLFEGSETRQIDKKALMDWVVKIAHALNDTKTAVKQLNKLISGILVVVIIVVWLLLLEIATTKVLLVLSSQLLLAGFIFKNICKTIFEVIIFVFVMHPFDVGDRCVIDGTQMIVEEMNILTTVFLRFDNEMIYYPNSVLATKPISNFYRRPDMGDSLEFSIDFTTPVVKIGDLKEKIKIMNRCKNAVHTARQCAELGLSDHCCMLSGDPNHNMVVKEIENVNKIKMALFFNHTMIFQEYGEKLRRKSELVIQMKRIFEELVSIFSKVCTLGSHLSYKSNLAAWHSFKSLHWYGCRRRSTKLKFESGLSPFGMVLREGDDLLVLCAVEGECGAVEENAEACQFCSCISKEFQSTIVHLQWRPDLFHAIITRDGGVLSFGLGESCHVDQSNRITLSPDIGWRAATLKQTTSDHALFRPLSVRPQNKSVVVNYKPRARFEVQASLKEKAITGLTGSFIDSFHGFVLVVIVGAVIGVANFDPVKRS
ncbi:mechanosensitive channel of small conductance-like 10 [Actinidia rufa]|uniref:Mechanosensitive channel of small conductance-like 10 n=1 Tax=Actinidia rufa TaxID=165716 RepID=A0A7J0DLZ2_9ERIC|nr:mechanosensitive channel of small conductance-like 10 [Actinidia rufa]